jgi:CHAT domain-containing protein/Tfp pilus assembly protein PilF
MERSLRIREKVLGPEHPDTATSLGDLAFLYQRMGFYDKALPLMERSLRIREKVLGPEHLETAIGLNNLSQLYQRMGFYDKALPLMERSLRIKEKVLGPEHPGTGTILCNLGTLHERMGLYDKALPLCERSLRITEKALGPEHPDTATSLNILAILYYQMDFYDKALLLYEQSLRISEKLGTEHPDTATSLMNLSSLYILMGYYDKALPLYERSLRIKEKVFSPEHPEIATCLSNLGTLHERMGFYDKALPLYERSLRIREKVLGPEHPYIADSLAFIGSLYLHLKDYPKAETYIMRSNHKPVLIELCLATNKYSDALKLLRDSPPKETESLRDQITFHTQEGIALAASGRRSEAEGSLLNAVQVIEELRSRIAGEKEGFFQAGYIRAYRELVSSLAESSRNGEKLPERFSAYGDSPASVGFYFAEATKARSLLESMAKSAGKKIHAEIPDDMNQQEKSLLNQLAALNAQWEESFKAGKEAFEEIKARKEKLTGELNRLIDVFRKSYPAYAALHYPRPVPAKELPLKPQEVLLEYALGDKSSALFLVRKSGVEKVIPIPAGREDLEKKVKTFMEPFLNRQGAGFSTATARELYDLLLADALAGVPETDEVVIIPDGILGLLPFEALVEKEGTGINGALYVGDRRTIRYYQSAAVLALQRTLKGQQAQEALFALGNPVFSDKDERYVAFKSRQKPPVLLADNKTRSAYRALAARKEWGKTTQKDKDAAEIVFIPLPETETEIRSIASLLGVQVKPPDILLNMDATERRLDEVHLRNYRYVHFATHADLPGSVQGVNEPFILLGQVDKRKDSDGFLTMSKVLGLELRADMVVLSACLTGRGKVMEGEGVANFARAFLHAGAKSVVVSLWAVSSMETVEYMERFYGYLKAGKTRSEALRQARSEIKARYPNPFIWAPFIIHGEG